MGSTIMPTTVRMCRDFYHEVYKKLGFHRTKQILGYANLHLVTDSQVSRRYYELRKTAKSCLLGFQNYQTRYAMQKPTSSTCKALITVFIACIGFAGWPTAVSAGLFSATGKIIAILSDDLFVGEAEGHLDGSGTVAIRSQRNPNFTCRGEFTSTAEQGGSGKLVCSDGSTAAFQFQRLTIYRGHGVASFGRGTMSFAYGFAPEEAAPYLKLPTGKKLKHNGTELVLADL